MWKNSIKPAFVIILGLILGSLVFLFYHNYMSHTASRTGRGKNRITQIEEGKQFQKLATTITSKPEVLQFIAQDPGKIQVIDFFSYACFWCYRMYPFLEEWNKNKPKDIVFYRFPVVFQAGWDKLAKAYYVIETSPRAPEIEKAIFDAVLEKSQNLSDETKLKNFFVEQGFTAEKFEELYTSFSINQAYLKSQNINNAFQVTLSPSVIVNGPSGSYFLTTAMAGNVQDFMATLNYIVNRERKLLEKSQPSSKK